MGSLQGRVAMVTGASRGIGRAIARALADAGADLMLTATTPRGCDEAKRAVAASGKVVAVAADLGSSKGADVVARAALEAFGRVDVLINNAGIVHRALTVEMKDDDYDRVLAVNLAAPAYLLRRLLPGMLERGWGRIVNISSISGTIGTPRLSAYCASKWGLNGLTKAVAEETHGTGVVVTAVLPGSVDTDMLKGSGFKADLTPEDVAKVVRYLCTEAPPAMNGSLVEVFG